MSGILAVMAVLAAIVGVVFKLLGIIKWSWWMILLPIWGSLVCLLVLVTFIGLLMLMVRSDK